MSTASARPSAAAVGYQLLTRHAHPVGPLHPRRHRVAGEQGHRAHLSGHLVGEAPGEPRLSELGLDREAVSRLELECGGAVRQHLGHERPAELEHLVVARRGELTARAEDPAVFAVELGVAHAAQPCLELVRAPSREGQVHVTVHEARHQAASVRPADRGSGREALGRPCVGDDAVVVPRDRARHGDLGAQRGPAHGQGSGGRGHARRDRRPPGHGAKPSGIARRGPCGSCLHSRGCRWNARSCSPRRPPRRGAS